MSDDERVRDAGAGAPAAASGSREAGAEPDAPDPGGPEGYDGPGAWGTWALVLLIGLLLIATAATVHSIVVTFTG